MDWVGTPVLPPRSFENEAKSGITPSPHTYRRASGVTVSKTNAAVGGHTARCVGLGVLWTTRQATRSTDGVGGPCPRLFPF